MTEPPALPTPENTDSDSDDSDEPESVGGFSEGFSSGDAEDVDDSDESEDDSDSSDESLGGGGQAAVRSIVPGQSHKVGDAPRVTFTNDAGVRARMADMITETADILAMDRAHVEMFLVYYKWNNRTLQEQWFDSPGKVRLKCGFMTEATSPPPLPSKPCYECDSCGMDDLPLSSMHAQDCGHYFCTACWLQYLSVQTELGPGCVNTKCMMPDCEQSVLRTTWEAMEKLDPSIGLLKTFNRYITRSYCNENAHISWCPAAGCEVIVEYKGGGAHDIVCRCGHKFCFRCKEEAHRPANCADVKKWQLKNTSESENVNWMLANTKDCPKCGRPIEKNQGCNHMTCDKRSAGCGHEFCWLCLGAWTEHGSATGGFYKCNKYEAMKSAGKLNEVENRRKTAENEINKYMHYLERFMNHKTSMGFAEATLSNIEEGMERLQTDNDYKITEVQFLKDAAEEVIEAHRVLRWTYVFGYYLENPGEKALFEFLQEDLEKNCDHLHELVESPLAPFFGCDPSAKAQFADHRSAITNHFTVTRKFMQNLLDGIDNGLTADPVQAHQLKRLKREEPSPAESASSGGSKP